MIDYIFMNVSKKGKIKIDTEYREVPLEDERAETSGTEQYAAHMLDTLPEMLTQP